MFSPISDMTADHFANIKQFNAGLWKVADELRANSNLASNVYFLPIMGLLFLRQATNRYYEALTAIQADQATGKMPDRALVEGDFLRRRAMMRGWQVQEPDSFPEGRRRRSAQAKRGR